MKVRRIAAVTAALWVVAEMVIVPVARAGSSDQAASGAAGAAAAFATVFAAPLKLATCAVTLVLGGAAYGLTMGTSQLLREELGAGVQHTCGGKYYVTPQEIEQVVGDR